ncbi:MAG: DNA (cytosine-5-)-methyltransferase [bacterium]|nr:DNA (cytosine-5-)-methyltransferase [bacterium]
MADAPFGFYEFFAGGGMARLGLGKRWRCLFANDNSPKKARAYAENFLRRRNGDAHPHFVCGDVAGLTTADLPEGAALSWGSFPCQDLSLAGVRGGLRARRSGTFWPFWELMKSLDAEGRPAPIVVLENVTGAITSKGGQDFQALLAVLAESGYRAGPMVMDAVHFVPQSRPRLFIVAVKETLEIPRKITEDGPGGIWHPSPIQRAYETAPDELKQVWVWWKTPTPPARTKTLSDCIEDDPPAYLWNDEAETRALLAKMSEINRAKLDEARRRGGCVIGAVYKRTRRGENGENVQRAEVRFDGVSGCLRTPAGGSSRQTLLIIEDGAVRSRLLSAREAARLMGAPERYRLPEGYNEAYHLMGDGLAVPVVAWLEKCILRPLAREARKRGEAL